jgi:cardiolipin synthase
VPTFPFAHTHVPSAVTAIFAVVATVLTGAAPAAARLAASAVVTPATVTYTLVTEPQAGYAPIYNLITSAKTSLDMTMYELTDTTAETDLAADAARGVNVRVILDTNLEKSNNTATRPACTSMPKSSSRTAPRCS